MASFAYNAMISELNKTNLGNIAATLSTYGIDTTVNDTKRVVTFSYPLTKRKTDYHITSIETHHNVGKLMGDIMQFLTGGKSPAEVEDEILMLSQDRFSQAMYDRVPLVVFQDKINGVAYSGSNPDYIAVSVVLSGSAHKPNNLKFRLGDDYQHTVTIPVDELFGKKFKEIRDTVRSRYIKEIQGEWSKVTETEPKGAWWGEPDKTTAAEKELKRPGHKWTRQELVSDIGEKMLLAALIKCNGYELEKVKASVHSLAIHFTFVKYSASGGKLVRDLTVFATSIEGLTVEGIKEYVRQKFVQLYPIGENSFTTTVKYENPRSGKRKPAKKKPEPLEIPTVKPRRIALE